jgi:hypothetical protein
VLSYGLLNGVAYHFFGHVAALKNDFEMKQKAFIDSQIKLASTEPLCIPSFLPDSGTAKAGSFNVNYFAQKETDYKKAYYPLHKLADFFYVCDIAFKTGIDYLAQCKVLLRAGSKTVQSLENSALNCLQRVTFFVHILREYAHSAGSLAMTLLFFYSAYQFNEWLKTNAFYDFKRAFELFEKELYTDFAIHLNNSGYGLYLQLLLMREGKKVLSTQDLCMLQRDIMHIGNFKSLDLIEAYVTKMKKSYQYL